MQRLFYDLHIHSCLSPCAEEEMTPNNVTALCAMLGLQVIALSDHNSAKNAAAFAHCAAREGLIFLPGMELETREEVHLLCLFADLEALALLQAEADLRRAPIKNKPGIFGRQLIMDERDEELGVEELLLITALDIGIEEAVALVHRLGGLVFAAHIDRSSNSVLSNLGFVDFSWQLDGIELSKTADEAQIFAAHPDLRALPTLHNSDAHTLERLALPRHQVLLDLPEGQKPDARAVLAALKSGQLAKLED